MKHQVTRQVTTVAAAAFLCTVSLTVAAAAASPSPAPQPATVVVSGLTNPRGFTWSADGTMVIALAGNGGEVEGIWAGGPSGIFGGPTASIVRIEDGCPVTVAPGLPSGDYRAADWVWGAMDVASWTDSCTRCWVAAVRTTATPGRPTACTASTATGR